MGKMAGVEIWKVITILPNVMVVYQSFLFPWITDLLVSSQLPRSSCFGQE